MRQDNAIQMMPGTWQAEGKQTDCPQKKDTYEGGIGKADNSTI